MVKDVAVDPGQSVLVTVQVDPALHLDPELHGEGPEGADGDQMDPAGVDPGCPALGELPPPLEAE